MGGQPMLYLSQRSSKPIALIPLVRALSTQNKSIHIPGLDLAFPLTLLPLGTNTSERLPLSHRDANQRGSQRIPNTLPRYFPISKFLILQLQGFSLQDSLQFIQGKHRVLLQISNQRQTIPSGIHPPTEPFYNECLPR